jgi:GH24 family phage-related lysozyme (muramidase)
VDEPCRWAVCSVAVILGIVFGVDSSLSTSEQGLSHIGNLEGCRTQAYQCSANVWTVGLGHTSNISAGTSVTNQQIAEYFVSDVALAEKVVKRELQVEVTQAQFDVMVSFVFNLGAGNFEHSTFLKKFNQHDVTGACNELLRWVYVNGKDCRLKESNCAGIVKRRQIEQQACLYGW